MSPQSAQRLLDDLKAGRKKGSAAVLTTAKGHEIASFHLCFFPWHRDRIAVETGFPLRIYLWNSGTHQRCVRS